MSPRRKTHDDEDDTGGDGEICPVCHQEYAGTCPIASSRCPYEREEGDEDEEEPLDGDEEPPEDEPEDEDR